MNIKNVHKIEPVWAATGTVTSVNAIVFLLSAFNIVELTGSQVAAVNGVLITIIAPFLRALVTSSSKSARLIEAALQLPPTSTIGEVEAKAADSLIADDLAAVVREQEKAEIEAAKPD